MPKITPSELWKRCLEYFKVNTSKDEYETIFTRIVYDSFNEEESQLILRLPSNWYLETVNENRFKYLIYKVIWNVFKNSSIRITYRILTDSKTKSTIDVKGLPGSTAEEKISPRTKKIAQPAIDELDSQLNEEYTFENFIEGTGNKLLRSVGQSIADNPKQTTFNPLFIYGSSGVGKTHLVNAIGIRLKKNFPEKRVLYVTANLLKVQYMTSYRENHINDFILFYQTIDVLIIDDIQELTSQGTQQAFFHIFNHLKMNGKQIIMTCDQPPSSIPGMEERLLTRFKWGLAAELERPDQQLCYKILESKVSQDGLNLDKEVIDYIAQNVNDSIRDLEGIVNSLIAHSVVYGRNIDLEMARQIVSRSQKNTKKKITIDEIVNKVCEYFDIPKEEVMSKIRKANIVLVRQLAMYLAEKHTSLTDTKIGLYIGGRNHATVIHSIKQINEKLASDKTFADKVQEIEGLLKG